MVRVRVEGGELPGSPAEQSRQEGAEQSWRLPGGSGVQPTGARAPATLRRALAGARTPATVRESPCRGEGARDSEESPGRGEGTRDSEESPCVGAGVNSCKGWSTPSLSKLLNEP